MTLVHFVEDALRFIGKTPNEREWLDMPFDEQCDIIQVWQDSTSSKVDYVKMFTDTYKPRDTKPKHPTHVVISWETAEYLSCVSGQMAWGNQNRRGKAAADLGKATEGFIMTGTKECFDGPTNFVPFEQGKRK